MNKYPEFCYTKILTNNEIGIIKRYEMGYIPITTNFNVDELNGMIGVNKGTVLAMQIGSMFGWDVPGANPDNYNDDGTPKR